MRGGGHGLWKTCAPGTCGAKLVVVELIRSVLNSLILVADWGVIVLPVAGLLALGAGMLSIGSAHRARLLGVIATCLAVCSLLLVLSTTATHYIFSGRGFWWLLRADSFMRSVYGLNLSLVLLLALYGRTVLRRVGGKG